MPKIRSIRGGSARLSEEERIQMAALLVKAGYQVRIGYEEIPGKKTKEYFVEYQDPQEK